VDVLVHSRKTVLSQLIEGQIGFGISSKQIEHHDLEYLPFFKDEVILIAPADHPWARSCHIHPDDLLDVPLIMREKGSGTAEVVTQKLEALDMVPEKLNMVMVLGNTEAIAMSVEEGIGLAFVSRLAAARGLALGRLVEISIEGVTLTRDLYIARNRRFPFTRSQAAFWEFTRHTLAAQDRLFQAL
jgi:DNA-binding transcriptional LysR family regulator